MALNHSGLALSLRGGRNWLRAERQPALHSAPQETSVNISVITACRNSFSYLDDCLDSVARQSHHLREHIVVDGGSRDGCQQRLNEQTARLRLVEGDRRDGIFRAWNRGMGQASGDVLGFLNADDVFEDTEVLARVAQAFEDPLLSAVYGDVKYVRHDDPRMVVRQLCAGPFSQRKLAWGWAPPATALFVRRSWWQRIGGFSPELPQAAAYAAALKLFSAPCFKSHYLGDTLVRKRLTPWRANRLGAALRCPQEELQALREAGVGGLPAVLWRNVAKLGLYL